MEPGIYNLHGIIKPYSWGGPLETAADIISINQIINIIPNHTQNSPIAEIWFGANMGTKYENTGALKPFEGDKLAEQNPYLVKLLNIKTPLSLQIHPLKHYAEQGRRNKVEGYMDDGEKSETSVVLSETFTTYAGFNPTELTEKIFTTLQQLKHDTPHITQYLKHLHAYSPTQHITRNLTTNEGKKLAQEITETLKHYQSNTNLHLNTLQRMTKHNPNDPALSVLPHLQTLKLNQGQQIHIPAGTPHAYVEGQILEICAPSDNTLRAGLTPKQTHITEYIKNLNTENLNPHHTPYLVTQHTTHAHPPGTHAIIYHSWHNMVNNAPTQKHTIQYLHEPTTTTHIHGPHISITRNKK